MSNAVELDKKTAGKGIIHSACLFLAILFCANHLHAGEPILTLAMARYDQSRPKIFAGSKFLGAGTSLPSAPASATFGQGSSGEVPLLRLAVTGPDDAASSTFVLRERPATPRRNPLELARSNLRNYGHARTWASVKAGYGKVFNQPAYLEKWNGAGWEEPSCGYLKISFSF